MALSTQTVIINVVVRGGNSQQVLNQLGLGGQKAGQGVSHANTALSRFVGTLGKALISMAGVLVAFNLFVTLPQLVARALFGLAAAMIKAGEETGKLILQTAGLLASFAKFGDTTAKSFENAIKYSKRLQFTFAELAAKSLATAEDMQKGFQVFVARGGLAFSPGDMDKAAKTVGFLTNLVIAMTGELQKERQIYTEIDALMQGQARAGSVVARLLKAQVGDLKAYLDLHRKQGDLLEDLQARFSGITEASERLGQTLTGMMTSITGSAKILNSIAFQSGAFPVIQQSLASWRDLLINATKELGKFDSETKKVSAETTAVVRAFAALNTAIVMVVEGIQTFIRFLTNASSNADILEKIAQKVLKLGVIIKTVFESDYIFTQLNRIDDAMRKNFGNIEKLHPLMAEYVDMLSKVVSDKTIMDRMSHLSTKISELMYAGFQKNRKEILKTAEELYALMARVTPKLNPITGPLEIMRGAYQVNSKEADQMTIAIVADIQKMLASVNEVEGGWKGMNAATEENSKLIARAEREIIKLSYSLAALRAHEYPLLQIQIEQAEQAELLKETYAELPKPLALMLELNKQITEEKIKQARQDAARDITQSLLDRLNAARASYNEFAAADAKAVIEAREISEKLKGFGEGLVGVATDLKRSITDLSAAGSGLKVPSAGGIAPIPTVVPTAPSGVRETLESLASVTAEINSAGSQAVDIENVLIRLGREKLFYGRDQNNVVRDTNLLLLQQVVYEELLAGIGKEISSLSLSKILEEEGEIAELEERRARDLRAISEMVVLETEQKLALAKVLNMQFDLEKEILTIRRSRELQEDLSKRSVALQRIKGVYSEINEVEAEHAEEMRKINELMEQNNVYAGSALILEMARYEWALKLAAVTQRVRESQLPLTQLDLLIREFQLAVENGEDFFSLLDPIKMQLSAVDIEIAKNVTEMERLRDAQARFAEGSEEWNTYQKMIDDLTAANLSLSESVWGVVDALAGMVFQMPSIEEAVGRLAVSIFYLQNASLAWDSAMQLVAASVAEGFAAMIEGTDSFGVALKKALGKAVLNLAMSGLAQGLYTVLTSIWPPNPAGLAAGAKQLAISGVLFGIAAALGAMGGNKSTGAGSTGTAEEKEVEPYWVRNQDVAAQQGIQYALGENTRAISRLNNEVSRLSKETGDTLVTKAIEKNPSAVVKPVTGAIARSYELQMQLGGALTGVNA